MRALLNEIHKHFTEVRCSYCGVRKDRDDGRGCSTPTLYCAWHMFPGEPSPLAASNATAEELADSDDNDD